LQKNLKMFDYDRLSLNVAQQFSSPKTTNKNDTTKSVSAGFGDDGMLSNGSSESQIFGNGWDNSPLPLSNNCVDEETEAGENRFFYLLKIKYVHL
jgi:hypothetical protein